MNIHIENLVINIAPSTVVAPPAPADATTIEERLRGILLSVDLVDSQPFEGPLTPEVTPLVGAHKEAAIDKLVHELRIYHYLAACGIRQHQ
jgi:hypothetical protein